MLRYILFFLAFSIHLFSLDSLKENGSVVRPLVYLLEETGYVGSLDFDSVLKYTQKKWLQFPKQRWEFEPLFENKKEALLPLFKSLELFETVNAKEKEYDLAILHGATLSAVKKRLSFLIQEYERGVRFHKIAFFTSDRPLEPSFEGPNQFESTLPCPKTEAEMILHVYQTTMLPSGMENIPYEVIVVSKNSQDTVQFKKPSTSDTAIKWLETNPKERKLLFISSQPYVLYQHLAIKTVLKEGFFIETIGEKPAAPVSVAVLLDTLTKCLFFEKLMEE